MNHDGFYEKNDGTFSYWEQQSFFSGIDIVIVGSGIVGLSAAIYLKKNAPSLHIAVLERGLLPHGASTRNAGFACFGSLSELLDNLQKYSEEEVFSLIEKRWKGLQKLRNLLGDSAIRFQQLGGYELFDNTHDFEYCANNIQYFNKKLANIIGKGVYETADSAIAKFGFSHTKHLIFNAYEGQIHTGEMMKALLEKARCCGVDVYNGLGIKAIHAQSNGVSIVLENNEQFLAKKAIVATNGFAQQLLPSLTVQPARGQVLITEPIPNLCIKGTFHYDSGYYYFRNIDNRILLGGGRNLDFVGETTTQLGISQIIQERLEFLLKTVILPQQSVKIERRWSGIMGFGLQQAPIVQQLQTHIYCAVKMQGMGVALGCQTGEDVARLVLES